MTKLIRSKHLSVEQDGDTNLVIHRASGVHIRVHSDVIDLIDGFYRKRNPEELKAIYPINDIDIAIDKLTKSRFLINEDDDEDTPVLTCWRQAILGYQTTEEHLIDIGPFLISCYQKDLIMVQKMAQMTLQNCHQIAREIFPFKRKILVCLLAKEEYEEIIQRYNLPNRTIAFVDAKIILIIKADGLSRWMKQGRRFQVSMKHELIHVLIGQHHYYLPNWLEEGICEYYSKQSNPMRIRQHLRGRKLISFDEIEDAIEYTLMDLDKAPIAHNVLYMQAHSFIIHLIDYLGSRLFWKVAASTGIRKDFGEKLKCLLDIDLREIEDVWREKIIGVVSKPLYKFENKGGGRIQSGE